MTNMRKENDYMFNSFNSSKKKSISTISNQSTASVASVARPSGISPSIPVASLKPNFLQNYSMNMFPVCFTEKNNNFSNVHQHMFCIGIQ